MKMKSTLVALALCVGLGASAHHVYFNSKYDAREEVNRQMAGHADVVINNGTVVEMDGTSGATFNGSGENNAKFYFRYDSNKQSVGPKKSAKGAEMDRCVLRICIGPKPEGSTATTVTPRVRVTSNKKKVADGGENKAYTMDFTFEPVELTDQVQHLVLATDVKSGDYLDQDFKDPVADKVVSVRYHDLYLDGAEAGQFMAWEGVGYDKYYMPTVTFDSQATWKGAFGAAHSYDSKGDYGDNSGVSDVRIEEPGTIFIQAEDFTPDWILGHVGHNNIQGIYEHDAMDGYANGHNHDCFWYDPTLGNDVHLHNGSIAMNPYGWCLWQGYSEGHSSKGSGLGLIGMAQLPGEFGTNYNGEYIDETSNKITKEMADKGFGSFVEYAFDMEQTGYLDISVLAGCHRDGWFDLLTGGAAPTKHGKSREEGGYEVEGMEGDYLREYGFSYILYLDDVPLRTAWSIRPPRTSTPTADEVKNPLFWEECTEVVDGETVNSHHLWIYPNYFADGGKVWWGLYRDHLVNRSYNEICKYGTETDELGNETNILGESLFKQMLDEEGGNLQDYLHPDYVDIPVEAGRHVIKVQSCGGATIFDELKLRGKVAPTYTPGQDGIQNVVADREDYADDMLLPAEYFDLQGRKVANPTNGIFIVKRGNKVTKQVIR